MNFNNGRKEGAAMATALLLLGSILAVTSIPMTSANAVVGDEIKSINLDSIINPAVAFCSIGVAFDGQDLYVDACSDPNIYKIDTDGNLISSFDVVAAGSPVNPNAMAFDAKRNGIWFGGQSSTIDGMPIQFWDFDDNSVTIMFNISSSLINPATGESFLLISFVDGLAYNEGDPSTDADDEVWFNDDVNRNIGVFAPDGTLIAGYDASTIDPSLSTTSGLAIGGNNLYLANNGGGDVFRADRATLTLVDQFTSGDERQEDMECDPVTFAPIEVMWVRTTPQGGAFANNLTAFEIEPETCGVGGGEVPPGEGDEGCTPGFWKEHTTEAVWAPTGFDASQTVDSVFDGMDSSLAGDSLEDALNYGGGKGVVGAEKILLRAAVAAILNAAHPDIDYPRTSGEIIADVNAALSSDDRDAMLDLKDELDADNNLGCSINAHGDPVSGE